MKDQPTPMPTPLPKPVEALPSTGTNTPGVWVVETESGSQYVIAVPPEGPARSVRIASYGYDRGRWRPYWASHISGLPDEPVTVGRQAIVKYSGRLDDWYRSTEVVSILEYHVSTMLSLTEVEHIATEAMIESTLRQCWVAHHDGRIDMAVDATEIAEALGISVERVLSHPGSQA